MQVASDVFCPSPLKGTWIVYSSFMVSVRRARVKVRTAKEQPVEGHLAASRETKNATKAPFHCHSQEIFYRFPSAAKCPEGFQRASGKPFGRLRRGETPRNRRKQGSLLPCHPQEICFLWEVSSACGRTRYFPRAGKYPKGAGGGQRVHAAWPPPVPPLLSNSAPLASQGRAPLVLLRTWEGRCRLRRSRSLPRCVGAG